MTAISEKQAYLMGWMYKQNTGEYTDPFHHLSPPDINELVVDKSQNTFYQFADYGILDKRGQIDFLRGVFDRVGTMDPYLVTIPKSAIEDYMIACVDSACDVSTNEDFYTWCDTNTVEFLTCIYYTGVAYYSTNNLDSFKNYTVPSFKWSRSLPDAVAPTKTRITDSGYDLTVVSKIKEVNGVCYYDTGIRVQPTNGYYFDIVARSSISKTGWMLANNVGIIDASYRGNIIVALVRVNPEAPDIELPMRLVQLIPRKLILMNPIEVQFSQLSITARGEGGFGSSG
jgi:dUTP pyrophosphatase